MTPLFWCLSILAWTMRVVSGCEGLIMDDPKLLFACILHADIACRHMLSEVVRLHVISLGSRDQVAANCDCDISLSLHPDVSKNFAGMTASSLNVCSTLHWYVG